MILLKRGVTIVVQRFLLVMACHLTTEWRLRLMTNLNMITLITFAVHLRYISINLYIATKQGCRS